MDEQTDQLPEEELPDTPPQEGYTPRPAWQVWAARIGLVIFVAYLIMYYIHVLRGGA